MYWKTFIMACFIMLILILVNTALFTDFLDLKASDIPYIIGAILVGLTFLLVDGWLSKKNVSNTERAIRLRRGEVLSNIRAGLLLAIIISALGADHFDKGNDSIFLGGLTGALIFITVSALFTGLLPLRFACIDRKEAPVTFWVFTLLHILAIPLFLLFLFSN